MNITITVAGQGREHIVHLLIWNYRPGRPAIMTGHPDGWEPAEGAEFDVVSAWVVCGRKYRPLPRLMREKIVDENSHKIQAVIDAAGY